MEWIIFVLLFFDVIALVALSDGGGVLALIYVALRMWHVL